MVDYCEAEINALELEFTGQWRFFDPAYVLTACVCVTLTDKSS